MEHADRRAWADQVSAINRRLNDSTHEEEWKPWVPDLTSSFA
jgi:hypothetical protein